MSTFLKSIRIGNYAIGHDHAPFIIAEMSGNHNQSFDRAMALVDAAAEAGAHALKLQTYTPDTITVKDSYIIDDEKSLWHGKELYNLYQAGHTPWEWHKEIFLRAKEKGMVAFSSPFDESAVDFLETLDVPAYKIASFENTDWILLKKVALTGKPIILSTGVSNLSDIDQSIKRLKEFGCSEIILLKCTSTYPASPEHSNLNTIKHLEQLFSCHVGLSDHTMGIGVAIAAIALGARVIEKHLTLSRSDGGIDSAFSLEPDELARLVIESQNAFLALGNIEYGIQESEKNSLHFKRSLYIVKDIKKGELISADTVQSKRPAFGIHTKYFDQILGKTFNRDLKKGTPLSWEFFS